MDYYREAIETAIKTGKVDGCAADQIITALIDTMDNKAFAEKLDIKESDVSSLVQQFEEQIRNKVRDIR